MLLLGQARQGQYGRPKTSNGMELASAVSLLESGEQRYIKTINNNNLSEDADSVGGQLPGDKECPFNGGRVWRTVPESDVRSVNR